MKIGVYFGQAHPTSGGGHSFQHEILRGLQKYESDRHAFSFFSHEDLVARYLSNQNSTGSLKYDNKQQGLLLEKAVNEFTLDLVWFVEPTLFQQVSVPFFYTVWDLQHRLQPYFPEVSLTGMKWGEREAVYRFVLPRAAKILTGTNEGKEEIMRFYGIADHNIEIVPFPTPTFPDDNGRIDINEKFGIKGDYLFYPAQFWPHKNHINMLRSLRLFIDSYNTQLQIVFTGSDKGNLAYVQETVSELGLESNVHFLGFVSRAELKALYESAMALFFGSYFGPDNLPPLEAFASGCPVLASRVPGAQEQLGDSALLFDPSDIKGMAESIKNIYTDSELRESLINKGRIKASECTTQNYIHNVYEILDKFEPIRRCWKNGYQHT